VTVTAVDVDDDALARAQRILGTRTKRDTINVALREVIRVRAVADLVRVLGDDVIDVIDRHDAWGHPAP
jgi:Arc/MetJ family transcription regulator